MHSGPGTGDSGGDLAAAESGRIAPRRKAIRAAGGAPARKNADPGGARGLARSAV
eukprot:COSAG06_NODE_14680_length_1135_cov_5.279923_1_plen_54_part_10